ncbi:MAG: hypothetical protein WEG56_13840 [Chloroflexota bacterium]
MDRRRILIAGIGASLVIAMWEMIVEALIPDGAGFFGTPIAIGATIVRDLQGSANPIPFDAVALILGLMGHMMNSVILAVIFGLIVTRLAPSAAGTIGLGIAWGLAVFAMMWFVVAPAIDPLMLNLNAAVFLAGHVMWGAALGFIWTRYGSTGPTVNYAR